MPLYEYECKKCGHRFERIQSFSAEPVKECPVCKGEVEKLISASAILFKGSGFYSTDYGARPAKSGVSEGGSAASSAASGSSEGSSGGSTGTGSEAASNKGSSEKSVPAKTESAPASTGKAKSE